MEALVRCLLTSLVVFVGRMTPRTPNAAVGGNLAVVKASLAETSRELVDIKRRLSELADDVLEGRVERGDGAVVSQILNVYLRAISVELKVAEQGELIERMVELETMLERQNNGRGYGGV